MPACASCPAQAGSFQLSLSRPPWETAHSTFPSPLETQHPSPVPHAEWLEDGSWGRGQNMRGGIGLGLPEVPAKRPSGSAWEETTALPWSAHTRPSGSHSHGNELESKGRQGSSHSTCRASWDTRESCPGTLGTGAVGVLGSGRVHAQPHPPAQPHQRRGTAAPSTRRAGVGCPTWTATC